MSASSVDATTGGATPGRGSEFSFVRQHGERAAEINALYNRFTDRTRTLAEYEWEWARGPHGAGLSWVIVEKASDKVVGHHGILRLPMVQRGRAFAAGRTENTIIEPSVRERLFYIAYEKRALAEALREMQVIYTAFAAGAHQKVRLRLGYRSIGKWTACPLRLSGRFVAAALNKLQARRPLPPALLSLGKALGGAAAGLVNRGVLPGRRMQVEEIESVLAIGGEYEAMWAAARAGYDLTIERSVELLRWRFCDNPHLPYQTWTLREHGVLQAIIVAHRSRFDAAQVLEIDDIICRTYDEEAFATALRCAAQLDPASEAVLVRTLSIPTPLYRAWYRVAPVHARLMARLGPPFFEDLVGLESAEVAKGEPWYVTPIFTEGLGARRGTPPRA